MSRHNNRRNTPPTDPLSNLPQLVAQQARAVPTEQWGDGVQSDDLVAINETTGKYETLPLANTDMRLPANAPFDDVGDPPGSADAPGESSGLPDVLPIGDTGHRVGPNARRLATAHRWLDKYFGDAESEQIDGRQFWGHVSLVIPFQNGEAGDLEISKTARDRCTGGRVA